MKLDAMRRLDIVRRMHGLDHICGICRVIIR
jgi:hypothetical protein